MFDIAYLPRHDIRRAFRPFRTSLALEGRVSVPVCGGMDVALQLVEAVVCPRTALILRKRCPLERKRGLPEF
jgi:hypothetical protein